MHERGAAAAVAAGARRRMRPTGRACSSGGRTGGSTARWRRLRRDARWAGRVGADASRGGSASCGRNFPTGVVRVVQQDAIDRLGLHRLLLEPEVLDSVTPDVHLAATLMSLRDALPEGEPAARAPARPAGRRGHRATARRPHAQRRPRRAGPQRAHDTTEAGRDRLGPHDPGQPAPLPAGAPDGDPGEARRPRAQAALAGGRADPRARPERQHGHLGRPCRRARRRLASIPTLQTRVIAFDTSIVDLTDELSDPVEVLFGIQLGGGTDIDQALGYCQTLVGNPAKTVLVLVTDLYEGGDPESMLRRAASPDPLRRAPDRPARALRRRHARRTTTTTRPRSPRSARRSSPARRTSSRRCWPPPSRAATSARGPRTRASRWRDRLGGRRRPFAPNLRSAGPSPAAAEAKGGLALSDGGIVEQQRYAGRGGRWGAPRRRRGGRR